MQKWLLVFMMIGAGFTATAQTPQPSSTEGVAPSSAAADLFNGLRYDMMQAAAGNWAKLPPDVRRKFDALLLIMDDVTAAPLDRRGGFLDEFLSASAPLVPRLAGHPCQFGLLTLRIAAFLEIGRTGAALESAQQMVAAGIPARQGATVRNFMATLERKGWLTSNLRNAATSAKPAPIVAAAAVDDPVAIYRVAPVYPPAAHALNLAGRVRVKFTVAVDGSVRDVRMAGDSCTVFDEAALAAVSQWRYKPSRRNGIASEQAGVSVALSFRLTG